MSVRAVLDLAARWKRLLIVVVATAMIVGVFAPINPFGSFGDHDRPAPATPAAPDYLRAVYSPLHFRPAAEQASDDECLLCHREVLDDRVREKSPAGIVARDSLAWYQRLTSYQGEQETFHRRHLVTPLARQLMALKCNTCHQGHDPREAAQASSATGAAADDTAFTLGKKVNPETVCLKCHGQLDYAVMGLRGPWPEVASEQRRGCYTCHNKIRTTRHQVIYLNAEAIETAGRADTDICYGCHGGRAWYRLSYPYPRHPWSDMPATTPDWARNRPGYSEPRFAKPAAQVNR